MGEIKNIELLRPGRVVELLQEAGWTGSDIALVLRRLVHLASVSQEDHVEVALRLNPKRAIRQPWMPKMDRERAVRESPALDLELLGRVRDARSRLNT